MATSTRPRTKKEKFLEVWRLGREYFAGRISQREFDALSRSITTPEPELPLGIGAVMPEGDKQR